MTPLAQKTYALLRQVPKGKVTTYKLLAHAAGTRAYRAIGQIMRTNPDAPHTPCHRVVASDGSLGGFKGKKTGLTLEEKKRLLKNEGITIANNKVVDFDHVLYHFK